MQPELVQVTPGRFGRTVALRIAEHLNSAVRSRGIATIALSGGPQMHWVYRELRELQLPWSKIEFWFADERCVPERHPASNWFVASDLIFSDVRIRSEGAYRIDGQRTDHEVVAQEYAERLPEQLDVALLELGLDGHLAGLFPDSPALQETERLVVAVETGHKPRHRITLTPAGFARVKQIFVLATGRDRAVALKAALAEDGSAEKLPASVALRGIWFVDSGSLPRR